MLRGVTPANGIAQRQSLLAKSMLTADNLADPVEPIIQGWTSPNFPRWRGIPDIYAAFKRWP
jgi:hypothetical protein